MKKACAFILLTLFSSALWAVFKLEIYQKGGRGGFVFKDEDTGFVERMCPLTYSSPQKLFSNEVGLKELSEDVPHDRVDGECNIPRQEIMKVYVIGFNNLQTNYYVKEQYAFIVEYNNGDKYFIFYFYKPSDPSRVRLAIELATIQIGNMVLASMRRICQPIYDKELHPLFAHTKKYGIVAQVKLDGEDAVWRSDEKSVRLGDFLTCTYDLLVETTKF
ncbi:hypothetical protein [Endozoicomonas sp. Mp262]|uniref:hypothetical protein n=1 Tax=Endozoicomonas sp. Mp262 TaxID=2919499 RepID=UPI0021DA1173